MIYGCSIYKSAKMSMETKYISNETPMKIFENGQHIPLVKVSFENSLDSVNFIFDTGTSAIFLFDTAAIPSYNTLQKVALGHVQLPNGNKIKTLKVLSTLNSKLYNGKDLINIIPKENQLCNPDDYSGLYGTNYFTFRDIADKRIMFLDFTNMQVSEIFSDDINKIVMNGYKEIKSDFFFLNQQFRIYLTVNGVEEPFHFDTGNNAAPLLICSQSKIKFINNDYINYLGTSFLAADVGNDNNAETFYYKDVNISIGNIIRKDIAVVSSQYKAKFNNVGYSFIKNFDWIVDYNNKKVYFKPNQIGLSSQMPSTKYKAVRKDNRLIIVSKQKKETKFNIGEEIISVNEIKVNANTICKIYNLLEITKNWSSLNIQIK